MLPSLVSNRRKFETRHFALSLSFHHFDKYIFFWFVFSDFKKQMGGREGRKAHPNTHTCTLFVTKANSERRCIPALAGQGSKDVTWPFFRHPALNVRFVRREGRK